jgi:putative Holliday junction resolvase
VRVLAIDFGASRTGLAICDETGTIARPIGIVGHVTGKQGFAALVDRVRHEAPDLVVVGLPVSLDGREHSQARAVRAFVRRLQAVLDAPVEAYDERFTTKIARARGGVSELDARVAALILEDYLRSHGD